MARPVTVAGRPRTIYANDDDMRELKLLGGTASNGLRILVAQHKERQNALLPNASGAD